MFFKDRWEDKMEKLKADEIYEIEGKLYKLCKIELGIVKRFYFKTPSNEEAQKQNETR